MSRTPPLTVLLLLIALTAGSCRWIETARNALTYPTIEQGEVANLLANDSLLYATEAERGLAILREESRERIGQIPPPEGSESIDALAMADGLLFVLDARPPGHLSLFSLEDPGAPRLLGLPRAVPVGPFSGISAQGGLCVVSGGTSQLTAWRYDRRGFLDSVPFAQADLGRGQPNALVSRNGQRIFVATHYFGPSFGLEVLEAGATALRKTGSLALPGAGFTAGGAKPANFPIIPLELSSDTLLVAYGAGLAIIGVSTTGSVRLLERIDLGGPAVGLAGESATIVATVAGVAPALVILEFSGPSPKRIARLSLPPGTRPLAPALSRTSVVVAAGPAGVLGFPR